MKMSSRLLLLLTALLLAFVAILPTTRSAYSLQSATANATAAVTTTSTPTTTPAPTALSGVALVEALRDGGYIFYFRHAATDFSQTDTDRQNLENCATQRNLSDTGRADSQRIGEAIRALGIPIGEVLASAYCRTRQTAELAFGRATVSNDILSPYSGDPGTLKEALLKRLATGVPTGSNLVLVAHQRNLSDAVAITLAEGEAAIFQPGVGKDGYTLIARVRVADWVTLITAAGTVTPTMTATAAATSPVTATP
jgi:phosphohistidine phosphatase SixA